MTDFTDSKGVGIIVSFGVACMIQFEEVFDVLPTDEILHYIKDGLYIISTVIVIVLGAIKIYKKLKGNGQN